MKNGIEIFFNHIMKYGDNVAFISGEEKISFTDFIIKVEAKKIEFKNSGMESGNIISIKTYCNIDFIISFYAAMMLGTVVFPYVDLKTIPDGLNEDFHFDIDKNIITKYHEIILENNLLYKYSDEKKAGLILLTTGSTGLPKAILHDFNFIVTKYLKLKMKFKSVLVFSLEHISGIETVLSIITPGGCIIFSEDRRPESVCKEIEKHDSELLSCTPSFLKLVLYSGCFEKYNLNSLKIINCGGEKMSDFIYDKIKLHLPNVLIYQAYGTTETSNFKTETKMIDGKYFIKLGEENIDYKIIDSELWLKNSEYFIGYIFGGNGNKISLDWKWISSGDIVEYGIDGYFRITGRRNDVINIGGEKVIPDEVEKIIATYIEIEHVKIKKGNNFLLGEYIIAEILTPEKNRNDDYKRNIRKYCQEFLPDYKIPQKIIFIPEISINNRMKEN